MEQHPHHYQEAASFPAVQKKVKALLEGSSRIWYDSLKSFNWVPTVLSLLFCLHIADETKEVTGFVQCRMKSMRPK